ncbi:MAG: DMT family transporter [Oscillospiraceae bacterium]|nr:DMT family transporter [Oscillospiraceae bacterium]
MNAKTNSNLAIYALLVLRSVIYGSTYLFTGRLLQSMDVLDLLSLRFLLGSLLFILFVAFGVLKVNFRGKDLRLLAVASLFEPVLSFVFETLGVAGTNSMTAGLLSAFSPAVVIVLETIILRERTTHLQKLMVLVSITGVLLISVVGSTGSGTNTPGGILAMMLCMLTSGLFLICSRHSSQNFTAVEITFFTTLMGGGIFNTVNVGRHLVKGDIANYFTPLKEPSVLLGLLFLGGMASLVGAMINNFGLAKLQASRVVALNGISPVTSVVLGVLINHESFHWYHAVGGILVLIGATGINRLAQKR